MSTQSSVRPSAAMARAPSTRSRPVETLASGGAQSPSRAARGARSSAAARTRSSRSSSTSTTPSSTTRRCRRRVSAPWRATWPSGSKPSASISSRSRGRATPAWSTTTSCRPLAASSWPSFSPRTWNGYTGKAAGVDSAPGRSATTRVLNSALKQAAARGHVSRNVAGLAKPPKAVRPKVSPFTPTEALAFLEAVKDEPEEPCM